MSEVIASGPPPAGWKPKPPPAEPEGLFAIRAWWKSLTPMQRNVVRAPVVLFVRFPIIVWFWLADKIADSSAGRWFDRNLPVFERLR